MKKTTEADAILKIVAFFSVIMIIAAVLWIRMMHNALVEVQNFSDTTTERYQTERVEMALATDFVREQLGASSTITHASRNVDTYYFQGDNEDGHFMFIVRQTAPATFEVVNGVSSLQISQPE